MSKMIKSTTSCVEPIPLRRLTSSKYTPSEHTTSPTLASATASLLPATSGTTFIATKTLQIQSPGKSPMSLPLPPKNLAIPIFSPATGRPVYQSIRPKRGSGSCFLVDAEDETEAAIAKTTYWFGPGRNPRVRVGRDDDLRADVFELVGKSLFTRAVGFESRKWGRFEWRYGRKGERKVVAESNEMGEIYNLLVLEKMEDSGESVKVAQLIRSEETRTPGTKASFAGNGGRLEMCLHSDEGGELIDEVTIVVTSLIMLKKEIDRCRGIQIAVMSGVGGGGS